MAVTAVYGEDVDLFVLRDGDYVATACAASCGITRTAELIPTTTADSGRENEYVGGATDADLTLDGVITLDELGGWQYEEWVANTGEVVSIRMDFTNSYGDRLRYEMNVLITAVGAQGDVNDFGAFNVTMKRSGGETVSKLLNNVITDEDLNPILDENGRPLRT